MFARYVFGRKSYLAKLAVLPILAHIMRIVASRGNSDHEIKKLVVVNPNP